METLQTVLGFLADNGGVISVGTSVTAVGGWLGWLLGCRNGATKASADTNDVIKRTVAAFFSAAVKEVAPTVAQAITKMQTRLYDEGELAKLVEAGKEDSPRAGALRRRLGMTA